MQHRARAVTGFMGAVIAAGALLVVGSDVSSGGVAPSTGTLYFSLDNESELYVIDTTDGSASLVGTTGVTSNTVGLSEGPDDGVLIGSTYRDLSRINADGSGFTVAGTDQLDAEALAYDPVAGVLYRAINGALSTADVTTGAPGPALAAPGEDIEGLAWRDDGRLYGLSRNTDTLFAYDIATNTWDTVGTTGITNLLDFGLAWDPVADLLYAVNAAGDVYAIDPDSADSLLVGNTGIAGGGGLAFVAAPAPSTTLVAGDPIGEPGGDVVFPAGGLCGETAGNPVSLTITGPGGAEAGPVDVVTGEDGAYEAELVVPDAPAGTYTISGTCTVVGGPELDLPDATVVLGATQEPTPSSQGPVPVTADPSFTG